MICAIPNSPILVSPACYHYPVAVAFYLPGQIPVYAFSLLLGVGAALGLGWMITRSPDSSPLIGVAALIASVIGGRAAYLLTNWAYYRTSPAEIIQLPLGGLAWGGALTGGLLAWLVAAWIMRLPPGALADALFPLIPLIALAAWLGCWLDGCGYGALTSQWVAIPARDEWGNVAGRVPVQRIGALLALLTLIGFDLVHGAAKIPGRAASLGLVAVALQLWWLTTLRADPAPLWRGYRLDLWAAWGFAAVAVLMLGLSLRNKVIK